MSTYLIYQTKHILLLLLLLQSNLILCTYIKDGDKIDIAVNSVQYPNTRYTRTPNEGNHFLTYVLNGTLYLAIYSSSLSVIRQASTLASNVCCTNLVSGGNHVLIAYGKQNGYYKIEYKILNESDGSEVSTTTGNNSIDVYEISLAYLAGNFMFAYTMYSSGNGLDPNIKAEIFDVNLSSYTNVVLYNTLTYKDSGIITTAFGNGKFVAFYLRDISGSTTLFAKIFSSTGSELVGEFQVSNTGGSISHPSAVQLGFDSNMVIIWTNFSTGKLYARKIDQTGATIVPEYEICSQCHSGEVADLGINGYVIFYGDTSDKIYYRIISTDDTVGDAIVPDATTPVWYFLAQSQGIGGFSISYSNNSAVWLQSLILLKCTDKSVLLKQGGETINISTLISTARVTYQAVITQLPIHGTLQAVQVGDQRIFVDYTTTLNQNDEIYYKAYNSNAASDNICKISIGFCYLNCASCDETGTASAMKCTTCVNGYSKKEDDQTDKNCYDNTSTQLGYVFQTNIFNKCYSLCNTCSDVGISTAMKCTTCVSGFALKSDDTTDYNCYDKATPITGYIQKNDLFNKCYFDCSDCTDISTSATMNCSTCKSGFYKKEDDTTNNNCYNGGGPLTGYILKTNIFKKCYTDCEDCSDVGSVSTMNCSTCKSGFYKKSDDTTNNNCYDSNNTVQGYIFQTNIFNKCYSLCQDCSNVGIVSSMKCTACGTGYVFKSDDTTDKNCYDKSIPITGYIQKSNLFNKCYSDCSDCSDLGTTATMNCSTCKSGFYKKEDDTTNNNCYNGGGPLTAYILKTNIFKKCYTDCENCTDPGTTGTMNCSACKSGFYKKSDDTTNNNCYDSNNAVQGYIFQTNIFNKCYSLCQDCSNVGIVSSMKCTSCISGYVFKSDDTTDKNCYDKTVVIDYYILQVDVFNRCYSDCKSCSDTGTSAIMNCNLCLDGYVKKSDDTTANNCYIANNPITGYVHRDNLFKKCYTDCQECTDFGTISTMNCSVCKQDYYRKRDDIPDNNCFHKDSQQIGYYFDTITNIFELCYGDCTTCSASGTSISMHCNTCKNLFYKKSDDTTDNNCYHQDTNVAGYTFKLDKFIKCYDNCSTCTNIGTVSTMNCAVCKVGYYKLSDNPGDNNNCYNGGEQLLGYIFQTDIFKPCYSTCGQCSDVGNSDEHHCETCGVGYYQLEDKKSNCYKSDTQLPKYKFEGNQFVLNTFTCYSSCFNCSNPGTTTAHRCITCKPKYYSLEDDYSFCYLENEVIPGYYFSSDNFKRCYSSCEKCSLAGDSTNHQCTKCKTNYYTMEDKSKTNCYTKLEVPGSYLDSTNNEFKKCFTSCSLCSGTGNELDNKCTTCKDGFYPLQGNSSQCVSINVKISGYFVDSSNNRFSTCYKSCKSCNKSGDEANNQCMECNNNFFGRGNNDNNCYDATAVVPGLYFHFSEKIFKDCDVSCYTCSARGDEGSHNCLKCKVDYFCPEDNTKQCYTKDKLIEGYKFVGGLFKKCENGCSVVESQILADIRTEDPVHFNNALDRLIQEPKRINNNIISEMATNFTIPRRATADSIARVNDIVEFYLDNSIHDIFRVIEEIFKLIHESLNQNKNLHGDELKPEVVEELKGLYDRTKTLLLKVSDQYVLTNMDNLTLLVSYEHFEVEVFDYNKYQNGDEAVLSKPRTSTIEINQCADRIKSHLGTTENDPLPIRKLDVKTDLLELNPYINNTKVNVTGLVSSRSIGIGAYSPLNRSKLDIDSLCDDAPMSLDFKEDNIDKAANMTDYDLYKRKDIDIFNKNLFKDCQSFKNNESHADFTTKHINDVTDVAIDCGEGCSYNKVLNSKIVKCHCDGSIGTEFNVFKQNLQFAFQRSKITIIACAGTTFVNSDIGKNPAFWFEMALIIFLISVIGLTFYCIDYHTIFTNAINFHTNFKPKKPVNNMKGKGNDTAKPQEIKTIEPNNDEKKMIETTANNLANHEAIDVKRNGYNESQNEGIVESEESIHEDHYKDSFAKIEVNQGTAEFLTHKELIQYDSRSHGRYLRDIFLSRHEIGKVFFLPNIYVPKYLSIMFLIQSISINFALNAILYDDTLIDGRNSMADNVSIDNNVRPHWNTY
jgi:hypothetical protein